MLIRAVSQVVSLVSLGSFISVFFVAMGWWLVPQLFYLSLSCYALCLVFLKKEKMIRGETHIWDATDDMSYPFFCTSALMYAVAQCPVFANAFGTTPVQVGYAL